MIYSFYIYRRDGVCLFKTTYNATEGDNGGDNRGDNGGINGGINGGDTEAEDEREKLVFGMAFSLKELIGQLSPMDGNTQQQIDCPLGTVKTRSSTMHTYETLTGFRFIIYTGRKDHQLRRRKHQLRRRKYQLRRRKHQLRRRRSSS